MRAPTLAPSPFGIHWSRSHKLVAAVFVLGLALFGYGVAVSVLGLLPAGWGPVAAVEYVVMAVGALLAVLMAIIDVWFWRQEHPRPLPRRAMVLTGVFAPFLATGAMGVAHWSRVGEFSFPFIYAVFLGQLVLGLQLYVGSLEPASRRRRLLVAEAGAVLVVVFSALLVDRGAIDLAALESYLVVSVGATAGFLLVGGLLYLMGHLLVCRPRYHPIP